MAMEIVEEARPVGQEPMLLEKPHRDRKAVVDADQSRAEAPPRPRVVYSWALKRTKWVTLRKSRLGKDL
jgi:hypothetical protein